MSYDFNYHNDLVCELIAIIWYEYVHILFVHTQYMKHKVNIIVKMVKLVLFYAVLTHF